MNASPAAVLDGFDGSWITAAASGGVYDGQPCNFQFSFDGSGVTGRWNVRRMKVTLRGFVAGTRVFVSVKDFNYSGWSLIQTIPVTPFVDTDPAITLDIPVSRIINAIKVENDVASSDMYVAEVQILPWSCP